MLSKMNGVLFIVIVLHILTLFLLDQYNLNRIPYLVRSCIMIVMSVLLSGSLMTVIFFFYPKYVFGRMILVVHLFITSLLMVAWRWWAKSFLLKNAKAKRLALAGSWGMISSFLDELSKVPNHGFENGDSIIFENEVHGDRSKKDLSDGSNRISSLLKNDGFDALAFDPTNGFFSDNEASRILQVKHLGKIVYDFPTLYASLTGRVPMKYIDAQWLLSHYCSKGEGSRAYFRIKRFLDMTIALVLLIIFAPLLVIISILILIDSKGRIIYRQTRLGFGRKPFVCYKFRTMKENAEKNIGPIWCSENDPRVTELGKILRKSRFDELPQLYNILKGDMSFVGPRPIREHFAVEMAKKIPFYWLRYDVKPGVTGWAQVNGRYAVPDGMGTFEYELFYIKNMSILLDSLTLIRTVQTVLWRKGK